jgi:hypothetical protein
VNTTMVRQRVDPLIKEMLLGHHTGLEEFYYRPEEQELLQEYLKCVDVLTVNNEYRQKREIATLRVQKTEMEELKAEPFFPLASYYPFKTTGACAAGGRGLTPCHPSWLSLPSCGLVNSHLITTKSWGAC